MATQYQPPAAAASVPEPRSLSGDRSAHLVEVASGVHAWIQPDGNWWLNNAGAVLGEDGAVLIDTCATAERTRAFLAAVAHVSGQTPLLAAVTTHAHGDHSHGNALLPRSVPIIAHPQTRQAILEDTVLTSLPPIWSPAPDWGIARHRPPNLAVSDETTVHTGGRRIEIRHPGYAAHTPGDLVVWLPDERVLFAGDLLFHQVTPLVFTGSVEGALRSLDWLAGFGAQTVVPGHGPLITRDEIDTALDAHARYYRTVQRIARDGRERGLPPLEAARGCDLGAFADWSDPERILLNLHRAYCDADGTTLDIEAAFTDTVTYHGGPLHCAL
ncbi:MBL fold metallo-hydrolase [Streptomyces swartbergensis]|uniref:MBL fold metallo-hydrolase n=1 Tax=Streptomyces swartbergensis TaxID=487165 RepID=A0A243RLG5_9ACTN|nr:MBL fold metallo-hydrolase [Streptomyces swartbergensis]OUC95749.1 MBL fold metallo-hydrolase [Streptomyces swartbergensis]